MSPNASYRTTARWRSASPVSARSAATSWRSPWTSWGSASVADERRAAAWRRSATTASAPAARATTSATTSRIHTLVEPNRGTPPRVTLTRVTTRIDDGRHRIVYQGEPGSNSHLACQERFPDAEAVACASFEDCFAAVETGDADLAMIPIDNSIAGRVADIHHFLPTSGLHVVGEHFLRIQFMLMAVPGASLENIKTVHSHVHALGQCRK